MGIIRKKLNLQLKKDAYPFQKDAFDEVKDKDCNRSFILLA